MDLFCVLHEGDTAILESGQFKLIESKLSKKDLIAEQKKAVSSPQDFFVLYSSNVISVSPAEIPVRVVSTEGT